MNGKLNTDNYPYQLNQTHRDDALRTAEAQRLAQIATASKSQRALFAGLRRWFLRPAQPHSTHHLRTLRHILHLTVGVLVMIVISLATAAPSQA